MIALPAHAIAAVPDDCPGTLDRVAWESGLVVVSFLADNYTHSEIVRPEPGMSAADNETHAVQVAAMGLIVGLVQHKLDFDLGDDVSDDDLRDALVAATDRGDLDVADLLELAVARGIGPTVPMPVMAHMGYRH